MRPNQMASQVVLRARLPDIEKKLERALGEEPLLEKE